MFNFLWPLQALLRPKTQFALFVVSFFTAKLQHLSSHFFSLPILLFLLYLPTFLLPDLLLLVSSKLLVYRLNGGNTSTARKTTGVLLALLTAACSAAQLSYYMETGSDIQWMAASHLVQGGAGGLRLILSGSTMFIIVFAVYCTVAWAISPRFYDAVEHVLDHVTLSFKQAKRFSMGKSIVSDVESEERQRLFADDMEEICAVSSSPVTGSMGMMPSKKPESSPVRALLTCIAVLTLVSTVLILQLIRPRQPPYAHMSGSLPLTLFGSVLFKPINSEFCFAHPHGRVEFPFEKFMESVGDSSLSSWNPPAESCKLRRGPHGHGRPHGYHGHSERRHSKGMESETHGMGRPPYDPSCDPLKLSNLNETLLESLVEGMKSERPSIKNVLLITMESTRKDVFPLRKDSYVYNTTLSSYDSPSAAGELDEKLKKLSETAAFLTGESTAFGGQSQTGSAGGWQAAFRDGMGGINVQNAITQGAFTFKSLLTSHCGVEPLPVDFTEEVRGNIYQPCFPHVMDLFNAAVANQSHVERDDAEDYLSWPWESALVQSITDQFDSQDILDDHMGFRNIIMESTISNSSSKYYPPKEPWINYFGYPETETLSYFRDLFLDARRDKRRLFISHVTSTPHHPFATPKDWEGDTTYMNPKSWKSRDPFDDYLNTIKYQNDWISQVFTMLQDVDALNETLVVLVGDHGLAFDTLDGSHSTVDNGHISNFAIPLMFVHPQLPRIQLSSQTTPTSILPTVLDLLLQTDSLPRPAADKAQELLPEYQGNSLIRNLEYSVPLTDGSMGPTTRQPLHFSAINPGGSLLAIHDAATSYRLILPLCSTEPLRFTNVATDPNEKDPLTAWTTEQLAGKVTARYGQKAKEWAQLAEDMGRWWFWEQRRRWGYWGSARGVDRTAGDRLGGTIKKNHWWET